MSSNVTDPDPTDRSLRRSIEEELTCGTDLCGLPADAVDAPPLGGPPSPSYGDVIQKMSLRFAAVEEHAGGEDLAARALYDNLVALPQTAREHLVRSDERFASFSLAERLLTASREVAYADPDGSLEMAQLALEIIDRLDPARYGAGLLADLRGRGWAYLGRSWLGRGNTTAAAEAFRLAESNVRLGSGDPLEEAEVMVLSAALVAERGELEEALKRLDQAASAYLHAGDRQLLGEALVEKGRIAVEAGEADTAIDLLREGVQLVGHGQVAADARTLLVGALIDAGRPEEAWAALAHARRSADDGAGYEPLLRWHEGRIAAAMDVPDEATVHLTAARSGLLAAGEGEAAALVHLDLAAVEVARPADERAEALRRLATTTGRIVGTAALRPETVNVLLIVQRAAESDALTPALVDELRGFLLRVGVR